MSGYDAAFYDTIRPGVQASAAVVVPLVMELLHPTTVLDVGCGEGWWADAFTAAGAHAVGVDGWYVAGGPIADRFIAVDLAHRRINDLDPVDLVVCLEVAEHLPPGRAASFVEDLATLAPLILWSAAIPGQGGTGHVNEQWPGYWVDLFAGQGMTASGALRWSIWDDARVENWYRQNLLVFARDPAAYPALFAGPLTPPWPVVHPVLYQARTGA